MSVRLRFLTFLLVLSPECFSQDFRTDTATVARAINNLKDQFYQAKRSESFISIGSDYSDYEPIEDEQPFFLEDDWIIGTVKYNGLVYENIPLQYDIRLQKLVTEHVATGRKIELIQNHVSWFEIKDRHFAFLNVAGSAGYYELLQDGIAAKLWAAHKKSFHETTVTGTLKVRTDEEMRYFVEKGNLLVQVKGKSTILNALQDKKESLKQALRVNRVNFNNKREGLIEAVRLYNSIL